MNKLVNELLMLMQTMDYRAMIEFSFIIIPWVLGVAVLLYWIVVAPVIAYYQWLFKDLDSEKRFEYLKLRIKKW